MPQKIRYLGAHYDAPSEQDVESLSIDHSQRVDIKREKDLEACLNQCLHNLAFISGEKKEGWSW